MQLRLMVVDVCRPKRLACCSYLASGVVVVVRSAVELVAAAAVFSPASLLSIWLAA